MTFGAGFRINSVLELEKYFVSCRDLRCELRYEDELFELQPCEQDLAPQFS